MQPVSSRSRDSIDARRRSSARFHVFDTRCVAHDVKEVVVDLARVAWLDAVGVDALLLGQDAARRAACGYRVTNPSGLVHYVLETTDPARRPHVSATGSVGG